MLASVSLSLAGCFGGTIAEQLISSAITRGADTAFSNALDARDRAEAAKGITLKDTEPDEYWGTFLTSGFTTVTPVSEPLPDYRQAEFKKPSTLNPLIESSRLVKVELWNYLIGQEKYSVLERARRLGATALPPQTEWPRWQVATGGLEGEKSKTITFLVPPDFGTLKSGDDALVEISGIGGVHIARYPAQ